MKALVNLAQTRRADMSVNFRGADVGVAEQFLDDPQVRAIFQQMSGKAMPDHVRGDVPFDICAPGAALDSAPERGGGEGRAAQIKENVGRRF